MLLCIYVFLSFSLTITVGCNGLASYLVKAQCYNAPASYAVVVQFKVTVAGRRQHVNMYSKTWIYILRVTISEKPHYTGPKMDWIRLLLAIKGRISTFVCSFTGVMFSFSGGLFVNVCHIDLEPKGCKSCIYKIFAEYKFVWKVQTLMHNITS